MKSKFSILTFKPLALLMALKGLSTFNTLRILKTDIPASLQLENYHRVTNSLEYSPAPNGSQRYTNYNQIKNIEGRFEESSIVKNTTISYSFQQQLHSEYSSEVWVTSCWKLNANEIWI